MSRSWSRSTSRRIAAAVAAGAVTALALFNGPAGAAGSTVKCTARNQSPVFGKWGDLSDYFLLPDGGFEVGNEWVLTNGAAIVTGNESWNVRAATDSKSLRLPPSPRPRAARCAWPRARRPCGCS